MDDHWSLIIKYQSGLENCPWVSRKDRKGAKPQRKQLPTFNSNWYNRYKVNAH